MQAITVASTIGLLTAAVAHFALAGQPHPFTSQVPVHARLAPLGKGVPTPNGLYDMNYQVLDQDGNVLAADTTFDVDVINGVFFDAPDFGTDVFAGGGQRFLQVSIQESGSGKGFYSFQPIEIKPHPRAQVAGEIFLPASKTVTTVVGTAGFSLEQDGTGGGLTVDVNNAGNDSSAIQGSSNGTGPVIELRSFQFGPIANFVATEPTNQSSGVIIDYAGRNNALVVNAMDTGTAARFTAPALFNPSQMMNVSMCDASTGDLIRADMNGQIGLQLTWNELNVDVPSVFNEPVTFTSLTSMQSNVPISQALGTAIISNTSPSGRALLAFNQSGGEGGFFSSIGGIGAVGDGTGPGSIALLGITNNGRAGVFQNSMTNSSNPTLQVVNVGMAPAVVVQQQNPGASGVPALSISGASGTHGLTNFLTTRLVNNVALGGNFAPGHPLHHTSGAHLSAAGMFINASSRELKEEFEPVDGRDMLERIARLPISTWKYCVEDAGVRHIGPTAEDFAEAFGMGVDTRSIGTVDADGVALAAIQGLHQVVQEKDAEIAELRVRMARLEAAIQQMVSSGAGR